MEGLDWLDLDGMRVLRADYGAATDPIQLMHAVKQEQYKYEGSCIFSLTDFGGKVFTEAFIQEYARTSRDLVEERKIIAAYTNLAPELFEDAKRILAYLAGENVVVEFFETEPAAIEWLLSFKKCD